MLLLLANPISPRIQIAKSILSFAGIDNLDRVLGALTSLVKWKELGLKLGLLHPTLEKIAMEERDKVDSCKMEMCAAWLRQADDVQKKGLPSWWRLLDALRQIDPALAAKIERSAPWL